MGDSVTYTYDANTYTTGGFGYTYTGDEPVCTLYTDTAIINPIPQYYFIQNLCESCKKKSDCALMKSIKLRCMLVGGAKFAITECEKYEV